MLKLKDILRLHYEAQLSSRKIALSLNLSRSAVSKYLVRATNAQLSWPLPAGMDEQQLQAILKPPKCRGPATALLCEPDFAQISVERSRKPR